MFEFLRRLFAPEPRSSETAKERLRLVLLSDHLSLAPDVVEALKSDLLAVISRYLEIDPALADVTFEQREREVAMLASIPIMGVRERSAAPPAAAIPAQAPALAANRPPQPGPGDLPASEREPEAVVIPAQTEPSAADEPEASLTPSEPRMEALQATEARVPAGQHSTSISSAARRRRRKRAAAAAKRLPPATAPGFEPA